MTPFDAAVSTLGEAVEFLAVGLTDCLLVHGSGAVPAVVTTIHQLSGERCFFRVSDDPLPRTRDEVFAFLRARPADVHVLLNPEKNIQTDEAWAAIAEWTKLGRDDRKLPVVLPEDEEYVESWFYDRAEAHQEGEVRDTSLHPFLTGGVMLVSPDVSNPAQLLAKLGCPVETRSISAAPDWSVAECCGLCKRFRNDWDSPPQPLYTLRGLATALRACAETLPPWRRLGVDRDLLDICDLVPPSNVALDPVFWLGVCDYDEFYD